MDQEIKINLSVNITGGPPVDTYLKLNTESSTPYILIAVTVFIVAIFASFQTQLFIVALEKIKLGPQAVEHQISASTQSRREVAQKLEPSSIPSGIVPHQHLFSKREKELISKAAEELMQDPQVVKNFPLWDGLTISQTVAVVVPMDRLTYPDDWGPMGLTNAGAICAQDESANPRGITIRERPVSRGCLKKLYESGEKFPEISPGQPQMTKDSIPRIALASGLVGDNRNYEDLKLTLLHEFVHVHGVPGFKPWYTRAQNDLMYLPSYNQMIRALNLDKGGRTADNALSFLALVGFVGTFLLARRAVEVRRGTNTSIASP